MRQTDCESDESWLLFISRLVGEVDSIIFYKVGLE